VGGKPRLLTLEARQRFMAEIEAGMRSCMPGEASRGVCFAALAIPHILVSNERRSHDHPLYGWR
jgi:hypothetical protein